MFETVLGRQSKQDIDVGESGIRIENAHARSRFRKRNTEINRDARLSDSAFTASDSESEREKCKETINRLIAEQGQKLIGWRDVPVEPGKADVGPTALASMPSIEQLFVAAADGLEGDAFERQLYIIRKLGTRMLRYESDHSQADLFYVCSLSTKVIVYKGMLTPSQLLPFYVDLRDESYE